MVIEELLSQIKDLALQNAILASMVKIGATSPKVSVASALEGTPPASEVPEFL